MEECVKYSIKLAKLVSTNLNIPVYLYEHSATEKYRKNLANIRQGEYEGLSQKMKQSKWKPDYGENKINLLEANEIIGTVPLTGSDMGGSRRIANKN